jgi:hypothetical protein
VAARVEDALAASLVAWERLQLGQSGTVVGPRLIHAALPLGLSAGDQGQKADKRREQREKAICSHFHLVRSISLRLSMEGS